MATLTIKNITKSFEGAVAVHPLDLVVRDGAFLALLGPSGCGKTTLLRMIAGLETPSGGQILIDGEDVTALSPAKRKLAMVFQNYAVFPHLTVAQNIAFGLTMQRREAGFIKERVARCAALLRLEPYLARYPSKLSGGQRQRVAVARALAVEPKLLLMDEPLSNLDALLRLDMRSELKAILQEAKTTTIYVTHDQGEALALADEIGVMQKGRLEQRDAPQTVYAKPASRFVGGFVGNPPMNFVPLPSLHTPERFMAGAPLSAHPHAMVLGFRAEDVALGAIKSTSPENQEQGDLDFAVRTVEPMGSHLLVTGLCADTLCRIALAPEDMPMPGARVALRLNAAKTSLFDATSGARICKAEPKAQS